MALEYSAYGQLPASNKLCKRGILVSNGDIRSIWLCHGLETFKKQQKALEEMAAKKGIVYTEAQLVALETVGFQIDEVAKIDACPLEHTGAGTGVLPFRSPPRISVRSATTSSTRPQSSSRIWKVPCSKRLYKIAGPLRA